MSAIGDEGFRSDLGAPVPAAPAAAPPQPPVYLFSDLAIDPPLEEFRRLLAKKLRSFVSEVTASELAPYRKAYQLGEEKIQRLLGEGRHDHPRP